MLRVAPSRPRPGSRLTEGAARVGSPSVDEPSTASIRARWVKACGRLPMCSPVVASISSRTAAAARRTTAASGDRARARSVSPIMDRVRNQPEGADRERPFLALEPGVGSVDLVAQNQAVLGQFVSDGRHGRFDALVVGGQESHDRAGGGSEASRSSVVVLPEHARLDTPLPRTSALISSAPPSAWRVPHRRRSCSEIGAARGRDPAHHLGRGELLGHGLPDPLVGLAPVRSGRSSTNVPSPLPYARHDLAGPGVELDIEGIESSPRRRAVADSRPRCRPNRRAPRYPDRWSRVLGQVASRRCRT